MAAAGNQLTTTVSVIIPTTCEVRREQAIRRSIASVLSQDIATDLILVVNGDKVDQQLLAHLHADRALRVLQRPEGNVSVARREGLNWCRGEFFCFLDDDDELLPEALSRRIALFSTGVDVVVTNGHEWDGEDQPMVPASVAAEANADPVGSFLRSNWFASPAAMFSTATVEKDIFDLSIKYYEWTYLFFRLLAKGKTIRYDDCITYRKHADTPQAASRSMDYALAYPAFLRDLLQFPLDPKHRKRLKERYQSSLNELSRLELSRGRRAAAWVAHMRCLANGGARYLAYSRHLFK